MLTASAFEEDRRVAMTAGINGFIRKPFTPEHLLAAIEEAAGIRLLRETPAGQVQQAGSEAAPSYEYLSALPAALREELAYAVSTLDQAHIDAILTRWSGEYSTLSGGIRAMISAIGHKALWEKLSHS